MKWFLELSPVYQAFLATLFAYFSTIFGASIVFFFKKVRREVLDSMLGFGAGVMIAASFWSLLSPAINLAEDLNMIPWVPALIGFLSGGLFLLLVDFLLPHLHINKDINQAEGIKTGWQRSVLLVLAITLHNIPEGIAIGVAFGAVAMNVPGATITAAIALAIGVGLQNFPEGVAVSVPLHREGKSRWVSFYYGQLSGIVEPFAGVLGVLMALTMQMFLPFALAFAAGAMIYVVVEELVPEAKSNKQAKLATIGAMLGFAVMMTLDISLG